MRLTTFDWNPVQWNRYFNEFSTNRARSLRPCSARPQFDPPFRLLAAKNQWEPSTAAAEISINKLNMNYVHKLTIKSCLSGRGQLVKTYLRSVVVVVREVKQECRPVHDPLSHASSFDLAVRKGTIRQLSELLDQRSGQWRFNLEEQRIIRWP